MKLDTLHVTSFQFTNFSDEVKALKFSLFRNPPIPLPLLQDPAAPGRRGKSSVMQHCSSAVLVFLGGLLVGNFVGNFTQSFNVGSFTEMGYSTSLKSGTSPRELKTHPGPASPRQVLLSKGRNVILSKGDSHVIFEIHDDFEVNVFVGPTKSVISRLEERFNWLDQITVNSDKKISSNERGRMAYLEMMKSMVSGAVFLDSELSVGGDHQAFTTHFDLNKRKQGQDWAYLGDTMTGWARLDNVRTLLTDIVMRNVTGDFIETGVWRGGNSMFARAVINSLGQGGSRKSYVCDSFRGLPPMHRNLHNGDVGWDYRPYLEVPVEVVIDGFRKYSLLDTQVVFAKGFFNETMRPLQSIIDHLVIIRLDGDMYESTVDVLYHLYPKLSVGGYVIVDDWGIEPTQKACQDFFEVHGIHVTVHQIDWISAYWQKTEQVDIQFWRYEKNDFKLKPG
jgi:O-methyltransferase